MTDAACDCEASPAIVLIFGRNPSNVVAHQLKQANGIAYSIPVGGSITARVVHGNAPINYAPAVSVTNAVQGRFTTTHLQADADAIGAGGSATMYFSVWNADGTLAGNAAAPLRCSWG